jgi:drug/metabolite transporter (DMT)-like permease
MNTPNISNGEPVLNSSTGNSKTRDGLLLALIGGIILSFDIPLIRLADGDIWSVMTVRCLGVGIAGILIFAVARVFGWKDLKFDTSRPAIFASLLYAATSVSFIAAVFHTTTANVVFILAFTGMFAVLLGWVLNGETPSGTTIAALSATTFGVALIVWDGLAAGRWLGDGLAFVTAFFLALAITSTRKYDVDLRVNVLAANIVPAAISAAFMFSNAESYINAPHWSLINGLIVIPGSFLCLAYAPRLLYGPIVAMAYLLETIFAPIWVWLIFSETPTNMTLIGGGIMLSAIIAHAAWEVRRTRE